MEGRGGVVTRVVESGVVRPGDAVVMVEGERVRDVQRRLLAWFDAHRRDLPWRRTKDPYAIWLSEVMCQQTQVATVIPYWERFLVRFPTVHSLASAPLDDVLALWSGLGYYARARNLHRAAQAVMERHAGVFPADLAALEALPGFGPYTAGAVGSIALDLDAALVDGNVARVLCRVEGWELGAEAAREKAWEVAPGIVAKGRAGDWNQALMELGATVCTPVSPGCEGCPLRTHCVAAKKGEPAQYPLPKERRPRKLMRLAALAVRDGESVLLLRRAEKGLFGGLWELPSVEIGTDDAAVALGGLVAQIVGGKKKAERVGAVAQALTHRDVQIEVFAIQATKVHFPEGARWVRPEELSTLGLSTLAVKTLVAAHVPVPAGHGRRRAVPKAEQGKLFG
jgi:A/G-specific adenine glycosylase